MYSDRWANMTIASPEYQELPNLLKEVVVAVHSAHTTWGQLDDATYNCRTLHAVPAAYARLAELTLEAYSHWQTLEDFADRLNVEIHREPVQGFVKLPTHVEGEKPGGGAFFFSVNRDEGGED